jgi:hypothetical protein
MCQGAPNVQKTKTVSGCFGMDSVLLTEGNFLRDLGETFDNYRGAIIQSWSPKNLCALMSLGVGFHSVDGAWGFVSAQVN